MKKLAINPRQCAGVSRKALLWLMALLCFPVTPHAFAQTCTAVGQRVANPALANSFTSWTLAPASGAWTVNALGSQSAQHSNDQGGVTVTVPTAFNTFTQAINRVSGGAVLSFDVAWNNADDSLGGNDSDGNQARLVLSYNGVQYAQVLTAPYVSAASTPIPGPTAGSSVSALNGATLLSGAIPAPTALTAPVQFVWATIRIQLPDSIAQTGNLVVGVQRMENGFAGGATDDFYVRNVNVDDRTLCLRKSTPNGAGNFAFTTTNLDTNHVTAGNQNGSLAMNTTGTTPVVMPDSDTATAGVQPALVMANPVTVTESALAAGYRLTGVQCDQGVTGTIGGTATVPIAQLSAIPPGTQVTCTLSNETSILRLQKALPSGRVLSGDQFTLSMTGTGAPAAVTTTGTGSTATGTLTHLNATPGTAYTLREAAAGTTALANYTTTYRCTNTRTGGQTPSGSGTTFSVTPVAGDDLTCTFENAWSLPNFGTCDARMFLDQTNTALTSTTLYNVDYASAPFTFTGLGSSIPRQGVGYNPLDNYIYGIEWGGASGNELIRIGANGSAINLGVVTGLPVSSYHNGVISPTGDYYVLDALNGGSNMYRINLTTRVATLVPLSRGGINSADMAWYNGLLWGVDSVLGELISINPTTGAVTTIGSPLPLTVAVAMWGYSNGLFASSSSTIYAMDPVSGAPTVVSTMPTANYADGANCAGASIQFNADLSMTKTNTPASGPNDLPTDTFVPGETRTYSIVVTNLNGSFGAQNITVSDPVPAGIDASTVSWTCTNTSGGSRCGATSGTGALNDTGLDLPPGAVATYLVTLTVPTTFTGALSNTVTITLPSTINDTNAANNTASDVDQSAPQLSIYKISLGGVDSFGFTGTNGVVAQTLTTTVAGSPVSGATQALGAPGTLTTITEATTPATYRVTDIVCTGLGAGGTATPDLANRTVTLDAAATALGANIVCTFTNTLQQTDIQVLKTASPGSVVTGGVVTYTIVVSNAGTAAATNAVLTDAPGAGQTCTVPSTTASCTATGGASCPAPAVPVADLLGAGITIPSLPVGGQVNVVVQCTVSASGTP